MPSRRETFDAEDVLRRTRRRAAHVTAAPMAAVALTAVLVVLGRQGALPWTVVGGALGIGWVAATAWMNRRLCRLRRVAWCVKLTPEGLTAYDYARRPITLTWDDLRRVDLRDDELRMVRSRHCVVRVPAAFDGFSRLARRVQREAGRHGAALWLNGTPLREAPLDALEPLLSPGNPSSAHGDATSTGDAPS